MRNLIVFAAVLFMLHFVSYSALARSDRMTAVTTEDPKMSEQSAALTVNMTDSESSSGENDSTELGEDEIEDPDSGEEDKITIDSKTGFVCPPKPTEITELESQCTAEYKAMKRAKCNMTEEEKMRKMNNMESLENVSHGLGKREALMADETMNSTEAITNTTKTTNMHHRKKSCLYYQCILKKMDVLDETMLPNEDMFKMWVANNFTDDGEKSQLQEKAMECFNNLRESGFYNVDSSKSEEVSGEVPNVKKGKTSCNAALKLLKCLSKQDNECPVFKFI